VNQLARFFRGTFRAAGIVPTLLVCTLAIAQSNHGDQAAANFKRGKVLFGKGDFEEAIKSYNRVIELEPNWAEAYVQRGYARRMNHDLDKALEDYDKATELDPRTTAKNRVVAQAYTNRGQILSLQLKLEDAISDFSKAIRFFAEDERAFYERAQARLLLGDLDAAISDYDVYIVRQTHDDASRARAYGERGIAKLLLGSEGDARKDVEQGLELSGASGNEFLAHLAFIEERLNAARQLRTTKGKGKIG